MNDDVRIKLGRVWASWELGGNLISSVHSNLPILEEGRTDERNDKIFFVI